MADLKDVSERLLAEARASLDPVRMRVKSHPGGFVAELVGKDGSVLWPNYAHGPDELLVAIAAEQRYLVEERAQERSAARPTSLRRTSASGEHSNPLARDGGGSRRPVDRSGRGRCARSATLSLT